MNKLFVFSALLIACGGCAVAQQSDYAVMLFNRGTNEVSDAHVRIGDFVSIGGYLSPGIKKVHNHVPVPIPDQAVVSWTVPDDIHYEKVVDVKKCTPNGFSGYIVFMINSDNTVTVTNEPFFTMPKNWKFVP